MTTKSTIALQAAIATVLAAAGAGAHAQQAASATAAPVEEVVVTGSRIKRQDLDSVGPVTVLSSSDIEARGVTSTEILLQSLPSAAGFGGNQTAAYWNGGGWGTAQVNLRGLGTTRTLVLLNGRRVVYGGSGANSSVDLNMIPTSLIDRIEVLKDGASAIYGADAVAGVVNIVTKQNFEGLMIDSKYGQTFEDDGEEITSDVTFGISGERGNLMAAVSYSEIKDINMADREPCGYVVSGDTYVCQGSSSTSGGRATYLTGPSTGSRINFNQVPGGDGDFFEPYSSALHDVPYFQWLNAVSPVQKTTFAVLGHYNLSDSTRFISELIYTNRQTNQIATPATLQFYYDPALGRVNFNIPASHPTNPTGQDIRLDRRRLVETDVRDTFQETDTWRVVVGFEGDFSENWTWDVSANWGRNTGIDGSTNVANLQRVYETLFNCNGTTVPCADYLGVGDISQEAIDYIMFTQRDTGGNEQTAFNANISGTLFELKAGPVGFAAGAESRKDKGWRDPDPLVVANIANTNRRTPVSGSIEADELYAEVSVPLLRDVPAVKMLEMNLAGRYSDYDLFGNDTNYKLGVLWSINDDIKLRATQSTAFRVPSVPELFGGISEAQLTTSDPCSNWSAQSPTSNIYLNCQAAGLPVNYVQIGNVIRTTVGGNPDLQPEDADTFTVGLVWEPSFAPGLAMTLDYWKIELDDSIQSIPGTQKLTLCYNSVNLSHPFCEPQFHTRDPLTGEVNFLSAQPSNVGSEDAKGYDLTVTYGTEMFGLGTRFDLSVSKLDQYDVSPFPGAVPIEYAGKITGGLGSFAEWRATGAISVQGDRWAGNWNARLIGSADDINVPTGLGSSVGNVVYHNAQFSYEVTDAVKMSVGVDNIFDRDAPFYRSWIDANTDTMTYDLMGRRWYLRVNWNGNP
ncbi:MAG: TonB-dependent receptor [Steroidobacteraceae bacterium]